jgi:hypothetical protein
MIHQNEELALLRGQRLPDVKAWGIDYLSTRDVIRWGISRHSITPDAVKAFRKTPVL